MWVEDAPHIDVDPDSAVCAWIDKFITGAMPDDIPENRNIWKLVKDLETHMHSDYCRNLKAVCRFLFPKPPSPCTLICSPWEDDIDQDDILTKSCEILKNVYHVLAETGNKLSMDQLLERSSISKDDYINSLKVAQCGQTVGLKYNPSDVNINGINLDILHLWRGNIDFQYVLDEYSTVMYVIGYMIKSEKGLGDVLKRVAKECKNDDISEQRKKIGKTFMGTRVHGAAEIGSVMKESDSKICK